MMGELVTLHCWGRLSVLPEVVDIVLVKGYLCRHPMLLRVVAYDMRRLTSEQLSTGAWKGYLCRHPTQSRHRRLWAKRMYNPLHIPRRVGLRHV